MLIKTHFVVDPSVPKNIASVVNREIKSFDGQTLQEIYNGQRVAFRGDPLVGTTIPGTSIPWDQSTEVQSLLVVAFNEAGGPPDNLQQILDSNKGPNDGVENSWNLCYEDIGVVPGIPPILPVGTVIQLSTGNLVTGIVNS